jgi:hypothetical protein
MKRSITVTLASYWGEYPITYCYSSIRHNVLHSSLSRAEIHTRYDQLITHSPTRSTRFAQPPFDSVPNGLRRYLVPTALALMSLILWLLMHRYVGLDRDAQIYAFQAVAKINPALRTDLYLQNTSQDQFTIFSPFYAWFIRFLGLEGAARFLTVVFVIWFLAAAWQLERELTGRDTAWLGVAFLVITAGSYGAYSVFRFSEQFLTARLPAEALVVTALACHFKGFKKSGLIFATFALLVHPLIAFPGVLVLICLWIPTQIGVLSALAGILGTLGIVLGAKVVPSLSRVITVMDPTWMEVVRERSQFLLLQYWRFQDWELNLRPFICLTITAVTIRDARIRKLSTGAILVGAAGMVVALVASNIGHVAILLQGQAWRWVWISGFVSALLIPFTAMELWRDLKCGPICTLLLIAGWMFGPVDGTACVSLALIVYLARANISLRASQYLRWAAGGLGIIIVMWVLANSWTILTSASSESGREPLFLTRIRDILGLEVSAACLVFLFWVWIRDRASVRSLSIAAAVLTVSCLYVLPKSFTQAVSPVSDAAVREFADWRNSIPPTSSVFVTPSPDTGSFVWFTLGRPNYLAINQSAGVIFSRATALEVRRRSEVLLPVEDPDWKILSGMRRSGGVKGKSAARPLTSKALIGICQDPQLGFVISRENVGFDPLRHTHSGTWKDWNLYDCKHVLSMVPRA